MIEQRQTNVGIVEDGITKSVTPTTNVFYDKLGRQIAVTDANGNTNSKLYNAAGQLTNDIRADGGQIRYGYNTFGERTREWDANTTGKALSVSGADNPANLATITNNYDKLGQLVEVTRYNPYIDTAATVARNGIITRPRIIEGGITKVSADVNGIPTGSTLETGATANIIETYAYDEAGRRISVTNGLLEKTVTAYDAQGNVTSVMLNGEGKTYGYDVMRRKTRETDTNIDVSSDTNQTTGTAEGNTQTWGYNYFGTLTAHTDMAGAEYTYDYDNLKLNQLSRVTSTAGAYTTFTYDDAGNLTRAVRLISYNNLGGGTQPALAALRAVWQTTDYAYDLAGRRIRERTVQDERMVDTGEIVYKKTYQDNQLAYDELGRLRDVRDGRYHVAIDYDAVGNRTYVKSHYIDDGLTSAYPALDPTSPPDINDINNPANPDRASLQNSEYWYDYDKMNRQILVDGTRATAPLPPNPTTAVINAAATAALGALSNTQGHLITYDKNGNRLTDTYYLKPLKALNAAAGSAEPAPILVKDTYAYDNLNRIASITRQDISLATTASPTATPARPIIVIDQRTYDAASRLVSTGPSTLSATGVPNAAPVTLAQYRAYGVTGEMRVSTYNNKGHLAAQTIYSLGNDNPNAPASQQDSSANTIYRNQDSHRTSITYQYTGNGLLKQSYVGNPGQGSEYNYWYQKNDGYQLSATSAHPGSRNAAIGAITRQFYDVNHQLIAIDSGSNT